jgi:hypothetical protein
MGILVLSDGIKVVTRMSMIPIVCEAYATRLNQFLVGSAQRKLNRKHQNSRLSIGELSQAKTKRAKQESIDIR